MRGPPHESLHYCEPTDCRARAALDTKERDNATLRAEVANLKAALEGKERKEQVKFLDVHKDSEEFHELIDTVKLNANGHLNAYVRDRVAAKKLPIAFRLVAARRVENPVLRAAFEAERKRLMDAGRSVDETRVRRGFHGSAAKNLVPICTLGLLRVGHVSNPSKAVDAGYFGDPRCGVNVSRCNRVVSPMAFNCMCSDVDYVLKYSNQLDTLQPEETAQIIMFDVVPGRSKHFPERQMGISESCSQCSRACQARNRARSSTATALRTTRNGSSSPRRKCARPTF